MLEKQTIDTTTGEVIKSNLLRGNTDFTMLYNKNIDAIRELGKENANALSLFLFLIEKMDQENTLIVSMTTLSEIFGVSRVTIDKRVRVLKEHNFINVYKSGNTNVYAINAEIAWKTWENKREYAQFRSSVLISKSEQATQKKRTVRVDIN
jgi:DNA-binding MarR family transcriptional regulator